MNITYLSIALHEKLSQGYEFYYGSLSGIQSPTQKKKRKVISFHGMYVFFKIPAMKVFSLLVFVYMSCMKQYSENLLEQRCIFCICSSGRCCFNTTNICGHIIKRLRK